MRADNSKYLQPAKPFGEYPPEVRSQMARNGAIKANKTLARKKMMKELVETLMEQKPTEKELSILKNMFPKIEDGDCLNKTMLVASLKQQALKGNVKAVELLLALLGELPAKEITGNVVTQKVFVSEAQQKEVEKHIKEVLDDDGRGN